MRSNKNKNLPPTYQRIQPRKEEYVERHHLPSLKDNNLPKHSPLAGSLPIETNYHLRKTLEAYLPPTYQIFPKKISKVVDNTTPTYQTYPKRTKDLSNFSILSPTYHRGYFTIHQTHLPIPNIIKLTTNLPLQTLHPEDHKATFG